MKALEQVNEWDDEALWAGFLSDRDRQKLAVLYERYLMLVYGVCLKYLQDRDEAKDAAMEIFEKLLQATPGQEIAHFRGWLYVVSKNHCLMKLRSQKKESEKNDGLFMEYGVYEHPLDSEEELGQSSSLHHCIEALKIEQKECVTLFYFEKKSYAEIADQKSLGLKEVKSHIQNGKRNIRICLENRHE